MRNTRLQPNSGSTLIQILVFVVIIAAAAIYVLSALGYLRESANYFAFLAKREQLRRQIITQFISQPMHCKCLLRGSSPFPPGGTNTLGGTFTANISIKNYTTPGDCDSGIELRNLLGATPNPEGLILNSVAVRDIKPNSGIFDGKLDLMIAMGNSGIKMLGGKVLNLTIPIKIMPVLVGPGSYNIADCLF